MFKWLNKIWKTVTAVNRVIDVSKSASVIILLVSMLFAFTVSGYAADRYWVGSAGGNSNDAANWSATSGNACGVNGGASAPGSADIARFTGDCTNAATINAAWDVDGVDIQSGYTGTIVQNSGITMVIGASDWIQVDGTFSGSDANIDMNGDLTLSGGTFTSTSASLLMNNNLVITTGTFNHNTGTVVDDGPGTTFNTGSAVFNDVTFNTGDNITITGTMQIDGTLNLDAYNALFTGTLAVDGDVITTASSVSAVSGRILFQGGGNQELRVDGAGGTGIVPSIVIDKTGGILTITDTIQVNGNEWTHEAGTVNATASKIILTGAGTMTSGSMSFNDVEINTGGNQAINGAMDVNGTLTLTAYNQLSGSGITVAGNLSTASSVSGGGNNVAITLDGSGAQTITQTAGRFFPGGTMTINKSSGTVTLLSNLSLTVGASQDLNVIAGTLDLNGFNLTVNDVFDVDSALMLDGGETISAVTVSVDTNQSTVIYNGSGTYATLRAGNAYYNLTFNGSGSWTAASSLDVNGTFQLSSGTFTQGANINTNVAGNFTIATGSTFNRASGSGILTLDGDLYYADNTSAGQNIGRLVVGSSPDTTTLTTNLTASSLTIDPGDALITDGYDVTISGLVNIDGLLDAANGPGGNSSVYVGGSWDATGGTFTSTSSTVIFTGTDPFSITSAGESFNNLIINDGMVGYWKFDETAANSCSGGTNDVCDSSGYRRDGTWNGTPTSSTTVANLNYVNTRSLDFSGSSDYVDVTIPALSDYTYSAWIYTRSFTNGTAGDGSGTYFVDRQTGGNPLASLKAVGGNFAHQRRANNGGGLGAVSGAAIQLNTWQHVAWGRDNGTEFFIYVNGVKSSAADALGALTPDNPRIGSHQGTGGVHDGYIDDVRIYNRALSAAEVQALANGNMPGTNLGVYTLQDALDVNANLTLAAGELNTGTNQSINVGNSWLNYGGVFTPNTGSVTLDGTSGSHVLLSGAQTFYNIDINGAGGTWTLYDNLPASNVADLSAGTLTYSGDTNIEPVNVVGNMTVTGGTFTGTANKFRHNGDLTISSGTYTAPTDNLMAVGSFTHSGGAFNNSSATVIFTGTTAESISTSGGGTFNNLIINDGLIGYWKFEESSAGLAHDSSGFNNHMTYASGAASPTVSTNQPLVNYENVRSLSFDGGDRLTQTTGFVTNNNAFSVAFWAYASSGGNNRTVYSEGVPASWPNNLFIVYYADTSTGATPKVRIWQNFGGVGGTVVESGTSVNLADSTWHHVVYVQRAVNNREIYIDGVSRGTNATSLNPIIATSSSIGAANNNGAFQQNYSGLIDEVRTYNRALTTAEIRTLANRDMPESAVGSHTLQSALDVNGNLIINTGELNTGANQNITAARNWINNGGVFTANSSEVTFDGSSVTQTVLESGSFYNLEMTNTKTLDLDAPLTALQTFVIDSGTTTAVGGTFAVAAQDVDINATLSLGSTNVRLSGAWDATGGAFTSAGQVMFTSTASETIRSNGSSFNDLVINDITHGLVGYWTYDSEDLQGTTAIDRSGNGYNGTLTNGPVTVDGTLSGGLGLNGTTQIVTGSGPSLSVPLTICAWYKIDAGSDVFDNTAASDTIVTLRSASANYEAFGISIANTAAATAVVTAGALDNNDGGTSRAAGTTNLWTQGGEWQHVCGVFPSHTYRVVYLNGTPEGTNTSYENTQVSTVHVGVGTNSTSYLSYAEGVVDDVRIYNRALTNEEIRLLAAGRSGGGTITLQDPLDINDDLLVTIGTLDVNAADYPVTIAGDWLNSSGSFASRAGTVTFDGASQSIVYSETFYDLEKQDTSNNATDVTLTFGRTSTVTILNTLDIDGIDADDRVNLVSSQSGTRWNISVTGTPALNWIDVSDSEALGTDILAFDSINGGNTDFGEGQPQWQFVSIIDISGLTDLGNGMSIRTAVNGVLQPQSTTTAAGAWTINSVTVGSDNPVVVWADNVLDASETTGVTVFDGSGNITGMMLTTGSLSIGSNDNNSTDMNDLARYDFDNDEDIMFTANSGTLDIEGGNTYTDETLNVLANNTLVITSGWNIETEEVINNGTITASAGADIILTDGSWTNSGSFTPSTSTVTFNYSTSVVLAGATTFFGLDFNNNGCQTADISDDMVIQNDLTVDISGAGCGDVMLADGLEIHTMTVLGDARVTAGGAGGGFEETLTVVMDGTSAQTLISASGGYFGGLQISNTAASVDLASDLDINGTLTIDASAELDVTAADYDINIFGDPHEWINNGLFTQQTATVTFSPSFTGDMRIIGTTTFYNLNFDSALSGGIVVSDSLVVQNDLTMNLTDPGSGVDSDAAETHNISVAGDVNNTNAGDIEADITIVMNGTSVQTISQTGTGDFGDITVSNTTNQVLMTSDLTVVDDITVNTNTVFDLDDNNVAGTGATAFAVNGTLELDGEQTFVSADPVFSSGAWVEYTATGGTRPIQNWTYTNMQINGAGGTFTMQADESISGQFMNLNGTFDTTGSNYDLTTTGSFRIFGGNFTANASTVTLNNDLYIASTSGLFTGGTSTVVLNSSFDVFNPNGANSLSNVLQSDGVTTTLTGSFSVGNAGVFTTGDATSTIQTNGAARDLQMFGTSAINHAGADFNTAAPTGDLRVVYFGGTRTTGGGNYNITPFLISIDDGATLTLGGSLTIGQFNFRGRNIGDEHTFDAGGQTFNASSLTIGTTGFTNRYSTFNGSASTINITTDVTILASDGSGDNTFNGQTADITVGDDWSNSGVFVPGTSTVEFTGNNVSMAGSSTFYNLVIEELSNDFVDPIVTFTAGGTFVIEGTMQLNGLDANDRVTLRSSAPGTRWNIRITSGEGNVDYLDVSDSEVIGSNDINGTNSLDTNNNDSGEGSPQWVFSFGGVIDITGTSNLPGGTTIRVAATGSFQNLPTTTTNGDGSWTISSVPGIAVDEILHIWAEGVADTLETTAVTLYDGSGNVTGVLLETNAVVIGSDDNATVTLTDLSEFDNDDDEDIMFTSNAGVLNVDAGGVYTDDELRILANNTLVLGAGQTLNARDVTIEGTLDTNGVTTIDITSGDWSNSGTFDQANSTVTFITSSGNNGTFSGATTFYDVSFFGAGTTTVTTGTLVSDNNLLLTAGTLDINDNELTVNGTLAISGGQLFTGTGTITFGDDGADVVVITSGTLRFESDNIDGGDIVINASTWNNTGGTVEFTSSSSAVIFSLLEPYNNLILNSTNTYTANNDIDVNGDFTLSAGTFNQNVSDMNVAGDFTLDSGATFTKAGATGTLTFDGDLYFADNNVVKQDLGRLFIGSSPDTTTLTTDMAATTLTVDTGDALITDGYEVDISGTVTIDGTLDARSGPDSNTTINVGGLWDMGSGIFTGSNSTVVFDGASGTTTFIVGSNSFYNLTIDDSNGGGDYTVRPNIDYEITGTLFVADGTYDADGYETTVLGNVDVDATLDLTSGTDGRATMYVGGSWDATGGTFTNTNSTVIFTGTTPLLSITSATQAFYNMMINDGLMIYYKFDESSSPSIDYSGYGFKGTWVGAVSTTSVPEKIKFTDPRAAVFDGNNDSIDNTNFVWPANDADAIGGPVTVAFWNYVASADVQASSAFSIDSNGTHRFQAHAPWSDSNIYWDYGDAGGPGRVVASYTPYLNRWTHVVLTSQGNGGSRKEIFINGVSVASSGSSDGPDIVLNGISVGRFGGIYHQGNIDDFRIYNRVLSNAEIQAMANGKMPGTNLGTHTLQDTLIVNGTLTLNAGELDTGGNDINIQGSWMNHGGVFTANSGNVYFDDGLGADNILSGSQTFYVVDITGSPTLTLLDNIPVSGSLTNSSGTLTYSTDSNIEPVSVVGNYINLGGTFNGNTARFRHDGNLDIQLGTYTAPTDVLEITGSFTHSGGTFTNSSSTVMFIGTLDSTQIDTTAGTNFNDMIINDGLVGYWKFDETATPAHDYSGYNAHGTWTNVASSASVPAAIEFTDPRSASFNGTSSYIRVTNHDAVDIGGTGITIAAWINVVDNGSAGSDQVFAGKAYYDIGTFASPFFQYVLEFDDNGGNTFDFYFTSTAGAFQGPFSVSPTLGQWNHVAFTYNGTHVRGYLNGVNTSTTAETDQMIQRGRDLIFGMDGGLSQEFNGQMDELRIYKRALSLTEIQALAGGTLPQSGLGTNTLLTDLNIDGTLFINSGELDTGSNRLINIAGSWFNHGGVFDEQTSTVIFDAQSGTVNILDMDTFYNLEFNDTPGAAGIFRLYSPLDINGSLSISGGNLDASTSNHTINLAGNWINNDTFTARNGTVTFDGISQSLTGPTTFYHLAKTESSNNATDSILTFQAGTIFTIGGTLTLQGLDADDRINLVSSVPGSRFTLNVTSGDQRARLVDVTDSQTSTNDIVARRSIEGTNTDTQEATPHWIISIGDIYEWTGDFDAVTWGNQGNWDFGDGSPGNDGYPDDNFEEAFILLGSDDINTPAGTLTIGGLLMTSNFSGSLTLTGTLEVDDASGLSGDALVSGGTIDHVDNTTTETNKLIMLVDGDFLLDTAAQINVNGLGYDVGFGPGAPSATNGGSYGGMGGDFEEDGTDAVVYGSLFAPVNIGSGGGAGGEGGGAVLLTVTGTTTIDGTVTAEGSGSGVGSGSGGSIYLTTGNLDGTGTLSVNGGEHPLNRGGGGGGRMAVILTGAGADFSNFSGVTTAYGGDGWVSFSAGAAGTVYLETEAVASGTGTLIIDNDIDNKTLDVTRQIVTQMPAGINLNNFSEIIIRNGGYLGIDADDTINFATVNLTTESTDRAFITIIDDAGVTFPNPFTLADYTLNADGISAVTGNWTITTGALSHSRNGLNEEFKINMTITGNLDIDATGKIDVSENGFEAGAGPGAPTLSPNGGGYGGIGGDHNMDGQDSSTYGSITAPTDLGSGGGNGGGSGERAGAGGGAIILTVTGITTVDGTMAAIGRDGGNHGSGSGGSIYLTTASLAGTGTMTVDGGTGPFSRGGGGGGRIAVILTGAGADFDAFDVSGTMTAYGGERWAVDNAGAAGTIYRQTEPQGAGNGILTIDNNNNAFVSESTGVITTLDDEDANLTVVGSLVIENSAYFEIGSDDELTVGGTLTTLIIDSTGTLVNDGTLNLGGSIFTIADLNDVDFNNTGNDVVYLGQDDNVTITPINTVYYNIRFDNAGTSFTIGNDLDVNGSFNLDNGVFVQGNNDVNVAGNFTLAAGTTFTRPVLSGTLTFDGDLYFADRTSPLQNIGRLVIGQSPDTTTLTTDMLAVSLNIMPTDVLATDGYEVTLTGTMDINGLLNAANGTDGNTTIDVGGLWDMTGGTFTNTNSTVLFSGTSSIQTFDIISDAKSFNNMTFDDNGGGTTWELEDNLDINGNLILTDGTLDIKLSESNQVNFAGNWTNTSGVLLPRQGTIVFDRSSGTALMTPADQTFYNVVINGSANPTLQMAGTLQINGSLSILDGSLELDGHEANVSGNVDMNDTLDASSGTDGNATIIVERNWDMTGGTFTNTNSTVMFTGTASSLTITSDAEAFNNLIINDGLIGYWKLDENNDNDRAIDSSGYANHGTASGFGAGGGPSSTVSSLINFSNPQSLEFDGADDIVTIPDNDILDGLGPLTFAAWINPQTMGEGDNGRIIGKYNGTTQFRPDFRVDINNRLLFRYDGTTNLQRVTSNNTITTNQWQHVAVTWNGGTGSAGVHIYVNGVEQSYSSSSDGSGLNDGTAFNYYIGNNNTAERTFDGHIDEVRIYNRVISSAEIRALANGNMPGTGTGTYTLQDNLDVNGTLTLNAGELHTGSNRDINVGRSWMNHGGIFTATSGDVFFDGASSNGLILSGSQTFYNVDITGSGVWTLQDNAPASSVFDVSAGTLTYSTDTVIEPVNIVGNTTITGGTFTGQSTRFRHDGNISISTGTYTAPTDVLEITGSFTHAGGTFANSGATVMFMGTELQTISTSGGAVFQDVVINDGLVGYWKMDETSSPAVDYSGYGNNGVWNGNVSSSTSISSSFNFANQRSLNFDGTNDYIVIQNSDSLDIGGRNITIAAWVFVDNLANDQIIIRKLYNPPGASDPTSHYNLEFVGSGADTFDFFFSDTSGTKRGPYSVTPTLGQWNHVAFTYDGVNVRGYINGSNTSTTAQTNAIAQRGQIVRIGTDHNLSQDFDGRLDELRVYNRTLSSAEIQRLANGNMPADGLGTYTLQTNLNVDGTLRLNTGTLDAGSNRQINIGGDWENFGGAFVAQAGTVVFDGADQWIPASETFYNLSKTLSASPSRTLTFGRQSTVTVSNTLTLQGFDGSSRLNLRSSSVGARFNVDVTAGPQTTSYLDVQDSEALSNNIRANNSVDSGNTDYQEPSPRWVFGPLRGAVMMVD